MFVRRCLPLLCHSGRRGLSAQCLAGSLRCATRTLITIKQMGGHAVSLHLCRLCGLRFTGAVTPGLVTKYGCGWRKWIAKCRIVGKSQSVLIMSHCFHEVLRVDAVRQVVRIAELDVVSAPPSPLKHRCVRGVFGGGGGVFTASRVSPLCAGGGSGVWELF
eukprot:COSAG01_NODE_15744_length_1303_cov_1.322822_3_plen_161_part_00